MIRRNPFVLLYSLALGATGAMGSACSGFSSEDAQSSSDGGMSDAAIVQGDDATNPTADDAGDASAVHANPFEGGTTYKLSFDDGGTFAPWGITGSYAIEENDAAPSRPNALHGWVDQTTAAEFRLHYSPAGPKVYAMQVSFKMFLKAQPLATTRLLLVDIHNPASMLERLTLEIVPAPGSPKLSSIAFNKTQSIDLDVGRWTTITLTLNNRAFELRTASAVIPVPPPSGDAGTDPYLLNVDLGLFNRIAPDAGDGSDASISGTTDIVLDDLVLDLGP